MNIKEDIEDYKTFVNNLKHKFNNTINVKIGNKKINFSGVRNIILNDEGDLVIDGEIIKTPNKKTIIVVNGNIDRLTASDNIFINGDVHNVSVTDLKCEDVKGNVYATNVTCGDVEGEIKAENNVTVNGDVNSSINSGNDIIIKGDVQGNVISNSSITISGDVEGGVQGTNVNIKGDKY